MKIKIVEKPHSIMHNRDSFHNYFAWPTVVRLADGNLAAVASGYRLRHVCPFGKYVISYSFNEGKSWTRPAPVIDTPLDDRDAGIAVSGNRVVITSFNNTTKMQRSWNNDKTQAYYHSKKEEYVEAYLDKVDTTDAEERFLGSVYAVSEDGGYTFGPVKKCPVTAPHGPNVTTDGGFFYVGRNFSKGFHDFEDQILCCVMDEKGDFVPVGAIPDFPAEKSYHACEPHAIMLPDGKIIVHIRVERIGAKSDAERVFTIFQSESTDGGKTFTAPHQLLTQKGGAPAHLLLLRDGRLISVYGYREKPYGIRAMVSSDGGESWQTDLLIYADEVDPDIGYPSSVELENGDILTIFYAHAGEGKPCEIMQSVWRLTE